MSELISKQAAIDAVMDEFKRIPTNAIRAKIRIEALPPAQPEPCEDAVSRAEVLRMIDCINDHQAITPYKSVGAVTEHLTRIASSLPPVTPKQQEYHEIGYRECADAVKSHSEKDILNMCISLLDEMVGYFGEYMEWIGYEPTKEEKVCGYFGMTYFHIVQTLFLYHTTHSGGTSTFKKCHELGIDDPSDGVRFPLWKEEEGDAE